MDECKELSFKLSPPRLWSTFGGCKYVSFLLKAFWNPRAFVLERSSFQSFPLSRRKHYKGTMKIIFWSVLSEKRYLFPIPKYVYTSEYKPQAHLPLTLNSILLVWGNENWKGSAFKLWRHGMKPNSKEGCKVTVVYEMLVHKIHEHKWTMNKVNYLRKCDLC